LSAASIIASARPAHAIEPLDVFLASARTENYDNREARATLDQRSAEATAAWLKLVPVVTVTGSYTHNQYAALAQIPNGPTATIIAENQGDFIASAALPIVDVGQWERIGAAKATRDSARSHTSSTSLDVERAVTHDWYQVVAQEAVQGAARRTLDTSEKNLAYVSNRRDAGVASDLDYRRAVAEVERNKQSVADGEYQVDVARIALATASGHAPAPGGAALPDDLAPEAPLKEWLATNIDALPSVRAQLDDVRSFEKQASATRAGLLPTLNATASEHATNAPGFGQSPYYTVGVTLQWRFDASVIASTSAAYDQAAAAKARADKARQQARDDIHTSWLDVERQIEKVRAARAQVEASTLAASVAKQRYDAGTANFLDVLAADRDAFSAEVSRIQADTDLAYSRAVLRIVSGRTLHGGRS
jgi:outer membrane protein TolC